MAPDKQRIQHHLKAFDFKTLFVEELGWDHLKELPLTIACNGQTYTLRPLVEKRSVKVYLCDPNSQGNIPDDLTLRRIEREVTKHAYEHIIIYTDTAKANQVWQWVKREPGRPLAPRHNRLHKNQSGELLAQKLQALAFEISEEEQLRTATVAKRVRQAFDVERVTKKFYDRFKIEHAAFLKLIQGITSQADREWYASLMMNRLMFIYFIQRQGFLGTKQPGELDGDPNYLSNRLNMMQQQHGQDTFHTFYRYFLLKLFHDGLSKPQHSPELEELLGKVPYLNGGLFDVHALEHNNPDIQIPNEAFEKLFAFFDDFDWHLDDRPLRNDKEINPDVLGYIFEKYINQKQMGAYYTKEDITEYISKNTIIPYIFDAAEQKCLIAFKTDGPVWSLLRDNPDRYIYDAVKQGCELPLPPAIEAGIHDISKRTGWNKPASTDYALPTETWREVVARRVRYTEITAKLAVGEITSINDLITYNLDIRQFAQDVITYCEGTDLLRAFYESIEQVTVLDPTCGSGAFLFAALTILEVLYEACLDRMQIMVEERDLLDAAIKPEQRQNRPSVNRFREILKQVEQHPSRRYFIYKSIIINNLYGVDIMEEATEICKLRLFLKLVSQVEKFDDIEPLPDIDFNIRAGNTLVGFATQEEVGKALAHDLRSAMTSTDALTRIEQKAQEVEHGFDDFRKLQTQFSLTHWDIAESKQQLREKLAVLRTELDRYLAAEYGIDQSNIAKKADYEERFEQWRQSHQPFHWWVEFYGIMKSGGFDVIIGNPPWKEYSSVRKTYTLHNYVTEECGNLHGMCTERALNLRSPQGSMSYIVQLPLVGSSRMNSVRGILRNKSNALYIIPFDDRPGKLFEGLEHCRSVIFISRHCYDMRTLTIRTTHYQRWPTQAREFLFPLLVYSRPLQEAVYPDIFPKYSSPLAESVLTKLNGQERAGFETPENEQPIYVHRIIGYFVKAVDFIPFFWNEAEGQKRSEDYKPFYFKSEVRYALLAVLNSSLFYWFWLTHGDAFHCGYKDVKAFRLGTIQEFNDLLTLQSLGQELMLDLKKNATRKVMMSKATGRVEYDEFNPGVSFGIMSAIDRLLAKHYGLTDEELDFIINYDIKYRMGRDSGEENEE